MWTRCAARYTICCTRSCDRRAKPDLASARRRGNKLAEVDGIEGEFDMKHKGTARLESERLILRPFVTEDAEAMFRNWASDGEVTRFLTWPTHADSAGTAQLLAEWSGHYSDGAYYNWAITLKSAPDEPIGNISVVNAIDDRIKLAEIGYCIGRAWWHRGITSEALSAVIDYMFNQVGVNKVQARHDTRNPNSGRVMRKCGLKYEGTLRQADWNNQGICDVSYYGLLADER